MEAAHDASRFCQPLPALIGESALCLWLLFKGIDLAEWNALAAADAG